MIIIIYGDIFPLKVKDNTLFEQEARLHSVVAHYWLHSTVFHIAVTSRPMSGFVILWCSVCFSSADPVMT